MASSREEAYNREAEYRASQMECPKCGKKGLNVFPSMYRGNSYSCPSCDYKSDNYGK